MSTAMSRLYIKAFLMIVSSFLLRFGLVAETNRIEHVSATNQVCVEEWTLDFPRALELAQTNSRPMLIVLGSKGCPYCRRIEKVLATTMFRQWVSGSGIYLVSGRSEMTNAVPAQARLVEFLKGDSKEELSFPTVGVYWPRVSNDALRVVFTGRRGKMPCKKEFSSLVGQFVGSVNETLKDYFATLDNRPSIEALLNGSAKSIGVKSVGPGQVSMTPVSGRLPAEGGQVLLTAKANKGAKFIGWRAPDGSMLPKRKGSHKLRVTYDMQEGIYVAEFGK